MEQHCSPVEIELARIQETNEYSMQYR